MNEGLALRLLEEVMDWDNATAMEETTWLHLMSGYKYDNYHDYLAGARFIGRLADWLQQFARDDRKAAYQYVRRNLVFISLPEMRHLVELFYPHVIEQILTCAMGKRLDRPSYLVWSHPDANAVFEDVRLKTLYLGLSDGARIDTFRRINEGRISNEQVVVATQVNEQKWNDVLKKLRQGCKNDDAKFERIFLIDDFVGSGTTLLRWEEEEKKWDGKLIRFRDEIERYFATHFERDFAVHIHHYLASHQGSRAIQKTESIRAKESPGNWFSDLHFTFGMVLPENLRLREDRDSQFWSITENYYNPAIQTKSTALGGDHVKRGFGHGGLPLILEHNTPNNSVALLWAETKGGPKVHPMRPLFRRAQRHW
jgi:hypothetical protein